MPPLNLDYWLWLAIAEYAAGFVGVCVVGWLVCIARGSVGDG